MKPAEWPASDSWLKIQDILALIYLYPLRAMCLLFPVGILIRITGFLAPAYARLRRQSAIKVSRRMDSAFSGQPAPAPPEIMANEFLVRELRKSVDDLIIRRLSIETLSERATVSGIEFLNEALAAGKGVIVISCHFHANRLAKYYLRRIGYSLMSIRNKVPKSYLMSQFGNRFLAPAYGRFLSTIIEDETYVQDPGMGASLLKRLRQNGLIDIHIDADASSDVIEVQCLNEQRRFPTGFLRLAELSGAALVPMVCLGNSSAFEIQFGKSIQFNNKSSPGVFRKRLLSLAALLESWVLKHPENWELWSREVKNG